MPVDAAEQLCGDTALSLAIMHGHGKIVRLLIDNGADVEAADRNGMTALMVAAYVDDVSMVQLLLEAGADSEAEDEDGKTALTFATEHQPVSLGAVALALVLVADRQPFPSCFPSLTRTARSSGWANSGEGAAAGFWVGRHGLGWQARYRRLQ